MGLEGFTITRLAKALQISKEEAEDWIKQAYSRSVVNKEEQEGSWIIGDFYQRLGVFCQYESEYWYSINEEDRKRINRWYLDQFILRNQPKWEVGERNDQVAPLDKIIEFIENHDATYSVRTCDCRMVFNYCNNTKETCISLDSGPNSSYDRGQARKLTKEEVIQLVKKCDKEGLMHTLEGDHGICNCCGDCCFEYQAARECNTIGIWPITHTIASVNTADCIHCGICVKRCHLGAFTKEDKKVSFDPKQCVGCGICVSTCPKKVISLKERL